MRRSSTQKVQRKIAQHHYVFRKFWDADFRSRILPLVQSRQYLVKKVFFETNFFASKIKKNVILARL